MNDILKKLPFKVALVQVNASDDLSKNIKTATTFVRDAHAMCAELVLLPENVAMMTFGKENIIAKAKAENDHPAIIAFADLARELDIWIHGGTFAIDTGDGLVNRTVVFSPDGEIAARYDKIHMFDVSLSEKETYMESETFKSGEELSLVDLPWGRMGLTTCYDVRFPHLYRKLAQGNDKKGADFISVPAAFTRTTGEAHWHTLLRARAIENGCFIFAPAQTGDHAGNRQTFGHSLIVNPWGEVLADGGSEPGVITAEIDPGEVANARAKIPSLGHDRTIRG